MMIQHFFPSSQSIQLFSGYHYQQTIYGHWLRLVTRIISLHGCIHSFITVDLSILNFSGYFSGWYLRVHTYIPVTPCGLDHKQFFQPFLMNRVSLATCKQGIYILVHIVVYFNQLEVNPLLSICHLSFPCWLTLKEPLFFSPAGSVSFGYEY